MMPDSRRFNIGHIHTLSQRDIGRHIGRQLKPVRLGISEVRQRNLFEGSQYILSRLKDE
jgi:hypothetical protein